MRAGFAAGDDRRIGGFDRVGLERRIFCTDMACDAGDGPAGADAGDQDIDLPVGIFPNLAAGGFLVDGGVGRILKLLGDATVGGGGGKLLGARDGAAHTFLGRREFQIAAKRSQ